jgi:hypothetical protein
LKPLTPEKNDEITTTATRRYQQRMSKVLSPMDENACGVDIKQYCNQKAV